MPAVAQRPQATRGLAPQEALQLPALLLLLPLGALRVASLQLAQRPLQPAPQSACRLHRRAVGPRRLRHELTPEDGDALPPHLGRVGGPLQPSEAARLLLHAADDLCPRLGGRLLVGEMGAGQIARRLSLTPNDARRHRLRTHQHLLPRLDGLHSQAQAYRLVRRRWPILVDPHADQPLLQRRVNQEVVDGAANRPAPARSKHRRRVDNDGARGLDAGAALELHGHLLEVASQHPGQPRPVQTAQHMTQEVLVAPAEAFPRPQVHAGDDEPSAHSYPSHGRAASALGRGDVPGGGASHVRQPDVPGRCDGDARRGADLLVAVRGGHCRHWGQPPALVRKRLLDRCDGVASQPGLLQGVAAPPRRRALQQTRAVCPPA